MKAGLMLVAVATMMGLAACQSTAPNTASVQKTNMTTVDGRVIPVNIQPISSFMVEVSSQQALCSSANAPQANCLQYRTSYQNNFNPLRKPIEGFNYQPGYAYLLDVKQVVIKNEVAGKLETNWVLNRVISRASAATVAN